MCQMDGRWSTGTILNRPTGKPCVCSALLACADHIIGTAKPKMERSGVVDTKTGNSDISDIRTSSVSVCEPWCRACPHSGVGGWVGGGTRFDVSSFRTWLMQVGRVQLLAHPRGGQTRPPSQFEVHPPSLPQGTFLERGQDDVIAGIEERIARWTLLPVGNGEGLQVGRAGGGAAAPGSGC